MTSSRPDVFSGRLLWLQYASVVATLLSAGVLAVVAGTGWSWLFFVWAVAVGLVAVIASWLMMLLLIARLRPPPDELATATARIRSRVRLYPLMLGIATAIGVIGASLQTAWPDIALTVYVLAIGVLLPLALMPAIIRRGQMT